MAKTTVQDAIDRDSNASDAEEATSGTKVDVYRNLQKGGYSVRSRETETYGLVIDHRESVVIQAAEFCVNESGRQDVLEEGVKNVHAVVRGTIAEEREIDSEGTEVTYNPYEYANFVSVEEERPIDKADIVYVTSEGVYAYGISYKN